MTVVVVTEKGSGEIVGVYNNLVSRVKAEYVQHYMEESGHTKIYVVQAVQKMYHFSPQPVTKV